MYSGLTRNRKYDRIINVGTEGGTFNRNVMPDKTAG